MFPGIAQAFTPQQAFISLKSRASGALVLVAAKASQSSPNDYSGTFGPTTIVKQIGTQVTPISRTAKTYGHKSHRTSLLVCAVPLVRLGAGVHLGHSL